MLSNLTCSIAIFVCVSMSGPISGGGLNPTFGLALTSVDLMIKSAHPDLVYDIYPQFLVSYIVGPFIGGIAAALLLLATQKIAP